MSSVWGAPGMRGLLAMTAFMVAGLALLLPLSPLWAIRGGADERGAGLVTATLMFFTIVTQLRVNAVLAMLGWSRTLALGLVLLAVPAPVQAITPELWLILATQAVRGLGFGILTVCGSTAVSLLVAPHARGRAVGAYGLVIALPQLVLTPAAPWLMATYGFPVVAVFGAVPLVAVAWMPQLGRQVAAGAHGEAIPRPRARTGRPTPLLIWRALLALLLATSAGGAMLTFATQLTPDTGVAALILVCVTAAAALCRWQCGVLSDRWGTRAFVGPLLVVGALGLALVGLAGGPGLLIAGTLGIGVAYGGLQSVTLVQAFADGDDQHRVSVAWNVGFDLGTGLGAAIVGALAAQFSFRTAFLALACACLLGALTGLRRGRPR